MSYLCCILRGSICSVGSWAVSLEGSKRKESAGCADTDAMVAEAVEASKDSCNSDGM